MAKTNWQDPGTSEIRSTHISGLMDAVGKLEESIGMNTIAEENIPLTEVYISENDRYRIFQAPAGKRNWLSSPAPVIKKNGVVITEGFVIDYGGGAIVLSVNDTEENTYTADVTYVTPLNTSFKSHLDEFETLLSENAIMHNNIYRGKYLGSSVTPEQYQAISSGIFEDLYIGDYWSVNGVNYRIAGFDYYYNTGDTACTTHHAVIVPDTILYVHPMNDTSITTGGYVGSKMYTDGLTQAKTTIKSAFSGHVLNHRKLLSNATSDGKASGWAWFDSEVELMTEPMVYGSVVWGGSAYNIGVDKSQLPLFKLNPRMINTRQTYWLRDVVSGSHFAFANSYGFADCYGASYALGVRPAFSIS